MLEDFKSDLVDIEATLFKETYEGEENQGAILISMSGYRHQSTWIPKASCQFSFIDKRKALIKISMKESMAKHKGLI